MNISRILFLAITLIVVSTGCSNTKKIAGPAVKSGKSTEVLSEEQNVNATYAYFNAVKEKLINNTEKALEGFAACLRADPKNHSAMYEMASLYNDQRKYNDALFFAKSAVELQPKNIWYQILLADTYEKLGKYSEATAVYQKLIKDYPDHIDLYFSEAETLLYQNKLPEAIKVYDQVEKQIGVSRDLILQKQRLYLKLGKVPEAANEMEKLIKSEPNNLENYSLLVELYQVNNEKEKAMETIHRMQAIDPENPNVALALAEYYRSNGQKAESFEQLKKAFQSKELNSEIKIRILTSYLPLVGNNPDLLTQALELSKELSESHPGEANPQAVYGDFLTINKNFEEARKQYRAALAIDKKNLQAWQQLLIIESELRDYNSMEMESDEALTLYADQSVLYLFAGIAKAQNKKYDEAASTLLSGSKMVVDNEAQLLEFYSNLGDAYNNLKKFEESDKYYDKALVIDPNNAYVLNNYSYYLSLRKEKLDKAAEMSKKSNELNPDNANNQDTYAWVLYTQGKFDDARIWLEKALQNGGDKNGTILEHYGDVLYKLGRTEEAVSNWMKAKLTGDHSVLIDKKIADKKFYE
jgi:tetratricopeptide (TPR) repeat protein